MSEEIYIDHSDAEIVLVNEVRAVILIKHPEIKLFIGKLADVLAKPDEIRKSITDDRTVLYYSLQADIFDGKWLVVVVKQVDRNFVSTIYVTDKIKAGEIVWKR